MFPLLLIHFWHGKYQGIGIGYIVFIYPSNNGCDAIFTCHDFPLSCLLSMFHGWILKHS